MTHETVPSGAEAARCDEHAETRPEELRASGRGSIQEEKTESLAKV